MLQRRTELLALLLQLLRQRRRRSRAALARRLGLGLLTHLQLLLARAEQAVRPLRRGRRAQRQRPETHGTKRMQAHKANKREFLLAERRAADSARVEGSLGN
jgi:hypothetical protein